ncbi:ASCH domain-containing protein [Companilactobacillus huachuanensis]|uniref:ASCH domain-containing protein n=1 Tax=Companilactobacillus huachuanensis TaxID=2559914 RepID=A0ABW1RNS1_9LACO|nr:ASCH domain-containing protein [Companilactobacillus huachuanensis]
MEMHLNHQPFMAIKNGTKTIEIRLNDEKRSQLKIGNIIRFSDLTTDEMIETKVLRLECFSTFKELFQKYSGTIIGSPEQEPISELDCENQKIYSRQMEKQYGALAIKLELI